MGLLGQISIYELSHKDFILWKLTVLTWVRWHGQKVLLCSMYSLLLQSTFPWSLRSQWCLVLSLVHHNLQKEPIAFKQDTVLGLTANRAANRTWQVSCNLKKKKYVWMRRLIFWSKENYIIKNTEIFKERQCTISWKIGNGDPNFNCSLGTTKRKRE